MAFKISFKQGCSDNSQRGEDMVSKINLKKGIIGMLLSVLMVVSSSVGVFAESFSYPGTINADGVRLRRYPDYGTILELMYKGERVAADKEMTEASGAAYYVKRVATGTKGYVAFEYVDLDYPMF